MQGKLTKGDRNKLHGVGRPKKITQIFGGTKVLIKHLLERATIFMP